MENDVAALERLPAADAGAYTGVALCAAGPGTPAEAGRCDTGSVLTHIPAAR